MPRSRYGSRSVSPPAVPDSLLHHAAPRLGPASRWERLCILLAVVCGVATWAVLSGRNPIVGRLPPEMVSLIIVANLVPAMALLVLGARRLVLAAGQRSAGRAGGRLHLRLVALFAAVAAVPTLVVAVFAALLFQYGVQFWFSDRARTVLENSDQVAMTYVEDNNRRIVGDVVPMAIDMRAAADEVGERSPELPTLLAKQALVRDLSEAVLFEMRAGRAYPLATVGRPAREMLAEVDPAALAKVADRLGSVQTDVGREHFSAVTRVDPDREWFLYVTRKVNPAVIDQVRLSRSALSEYTAMLAKGGVLQLRFGLVLVAVSLVLLAVVIWAALRLATRLTEPLAELANAAERLGEGDFSARVPMDGAPDEIATLSRAFNRMTGQLEAQNRALIDAGAQIDARRRLTEAVLTGVSAGVLAIDRARTVRMMNASAATLMGIDQHSVIGCRLEDVAPAFLPMLERAELQQETAGEVAIPREGDAQTFAVRLVKLAGTDGGAVLTFDDISQQLIDQRRAAWADVARRIAHEIKNPLTPIQLSAERLQRKFGTQVPAEQELFQNLTATIVRQVGDLRRMVDEFSAFARMPKPQFEQADLSAIAREVLLLQESASPAIRFTLDVPSALPPFVCDRRQIGQALTNLVKNAVEAIDARGPDRPQVHVSVATAPGVLTLSVEDNGVGLPNENRARLTEPYVTTRARGTGLGLAIVKKIVEDHGGELLLADSPLGGARVALRFSLTRLNALIEPHPLLEMAAE